MAWMRGSSTPVESRFLRLHLFFGSRFFSTTTTRDLYFQYMPWIRGASKRATRGGSTKEEKAFLRLRRIPYARQENLSYHFPLYDDPVPLFKKYMALISGGSTQVKKAILRLRWRCGRAGESSILDPQPHFIKLLKKSFQEKARSRTHRRIHYASM